jgi:hypothetical protein
VHALLAVVLSAASAAIPPSASKGVARAAGPSAFLPVSVPAGYGFVRWKNESPNVAPFAGGAWFTMTFARGSARLLWTVWVTAGAGGDQKCSDLSVGHASVGGQAVYWGSVTTYDPLGGGPKGRHVWRCVNSADGRRLILDAFDEGAHLPIPVTSRIVRNATSASR